MDGRGRYLDNIFIERLWRSLKQEAVYLHELQDGLQAKRVIKDWISFYNTERRHTALDKRSRDDAFFDQERSQKAARNQPSYILAEPKACPEKQDHFIAVTRWALSSSPSKLMESRCESLILRVIQQRQTNL